MGSFAFGAVLLWRLLPLGYQSMAPTGQWYGRTFTGLKPGTRQLALTYDDGPNDPHTLRLLEVFAKHNVKATFFLIGRYVQSRPDIARELVRAGHVVGNHTFSHPNLIFVSARQTTEAIAGLRAGIDGCGGRAFAAVSSSVWWTAAEYSAHRANAGAGASDVECHWLGLERKTSGVHRAQSHAAGSRRGCDSVARWRSFGVWGGSFANA